MDDNEIVELYWSREEKAILETDKKYGKYCRYIANNILQNKEDTEECVNDTYFNTWNSIPPQRPNIFKTFLGKIARNVALNIYERKKAKKRNGVLEVALEELNECIVAGANVEQEIQYNELVQKLNNFIKNLPQDKRKIFLERYWYLDSIKEISSKNKMSESSVKITLFRIREKLNMYLKDGDLYE